LFGIDKGSLKAILNYFLLSKIPILLIIFSFRNLVTALVKHDRITTTLAKAKELRPLADKVIHKAKQGGYQGNVFLFKTLFTKDAIQRVKNELVPRYQ
jgi:large subunit ribosomal protein L17